MLNAELLHKRSISFEHSRAYIKSQVRALIIIVFERSRNDYMKSETKRHFITYPRKSFKFTLLAELLNSIPAQ